MAEAQVAEKGSGNSYAIGSLIFELAAFETNVANFHAAQLEAESTGGAGIKVMVARLNHDDHALGGAAAEAMHTNPPDGRGNSMSRSPASTGPAGKIHNAAAANSFTDPIRKLIAQWVANSSNLGMRSLALIGSSDQAAIKQLLADIRAYAARANNFVEAQDHGIAAPFASEMTSHGNAGTIAGLLGHALQIGDRSLVESAAAALADNAADVAANTMTLSAGTRQCQWPERRSGPVGRARRVAVWLAGKPSAPDRRQS